MLTVLAPCCSRCVPGGKKTLDEASRQKLAPAAYKKGASAFNKHVTIGNDGLGLNFAPLDTID